MPCTHNDSQDKPKSSGHKSQAGSSQNKPSKPVGLAEQQGKKPCPMRSKEDRDRLDKLCAEGRCFHCEQTGHDARNCSAQKTAKAPTQGLCASTVRFEGIEELANRVCKAPSYNTVGVASVRIAEAPPTVESCLVVRPWLQSNLTWDDCAEYL